MNVGQNAVDLSITGDGDVGNEPNEVEQALQFIAEAMAGSRSAEALQTGRQQRAETIWFGSKSPEC